MDVPVWLLISAGLALVAGGTWYGWFMRGCKEEEKQFGQEAESGDDNCCDAPEKEAENVVEPEKIEEAEKPKVEVVEKDQ